MFRSLLLAATFALLAPALRAQSTSPSALPSPSPAPAVAIATGASSVDDQVKALVQGPDPTVVHLWATWCGNCVSEMKEGGWAKFIAANPQTKFIFVTVWDGGKEGKDLLTKHGIAELPNVTILAHPGGRKENRLTTFMDIPVTWTPTTWVLRKGRVAYALNYGEIRFPMLQQMLDDSRAKW